MTDPASPQNHAPTAAPRSRTTTPGAPKQTKARAAANSIVDLPGISAVVNALSQPTRDAIAADAQAAQDLHETVLALLRGYDEELRNPNLTREERDEIRAKKDALPQLEGDKLTEGRQHRTGLLQEHKGLIVTIAGAGALAVVSAKSPQAGKDLFAAATKLMAKSTAALPPVL